MNNSTNSPTKTFIRFVKYLISTLEKQEDLFEQETGFKYNEVAILEYLLREGEQPITQTALKFNIMPSQMTFVVDRMEIASYVRRVRKVDNRRTIYLQATDKAKNLVENYEESYAKVMETVLNNISSKEKDILLEILEKVGQKK
ncbi:MAG: MarR family winged helix-turn-helix transcriptional regulator [Bacteroidia bacterium]|nr:MarR family winged helix-turn-helix transcriptional regulator [Bacteroidia bacterium]MDW8345448.1 MarR family winged helix-turn-helix transcriptional regulator [Bacteroidia bacterium]